MKHLAKKAAFGLTALTLVTSLASCGRREHFEALAESEREAQSLADHLREETNVLEIDTRPRETLAVAPDTQPAEPPETDESGETGEPETDSYGLPVLDNAVDPNDPYPNGEGYRMTAVLNLGLPGTYDGKSPEELTEIFRDAHGYGAVPAGGTQIITPTGIIFELNMGAGSFFYNKITGNITSMCADPLCNHDHCIWASHPDVVYITEEHLYLTVQSDDAWSGLYRCDHDRNHMEKLEGVDITSDPRILYVTGDLMYLQNLTYISEEAAIQRFGVLNMKTGEFTFLSGEESIWVYAVTGDTVWYSDYWQTGPLYKADLAFTHTEVAFPEYEVSQVWDIGKESFNLYGAPEDGEISPTPFASYNFVTGEVSVFSEEVKQAVDDSYAVDSQYVYYRKYVTDEEMAVSPLRRFYQYKRWSQRLEDNPALLDRLPEKYWYYSTPADGGRLWRMNLTTGEEEMVVELSFDGVPVSFSECVPDGNMLLVRFTTYKYYNNYYNQDFRFLGMITGTERTFYATLDLSNGQLRFLNIGG